MIENQTFLKMELKFTVLLTGLYFFWLMFNLELITWLITEFYDFTAPSEEKLPRHNRWIVQEGKLEATQLIKFYGYPAENHSIFTKDGYLLKLHRIPSGKNQTRGGFPVLLQHGILCSSPQWINSKEESLGFVLANTGFDVWMGNFRCNCYSKYHKTLSKKDNDYWKFGWDKLAKYDIPTMISYIRHVTGYDQILTIGHSMGFTALATALASQPNLNNKVKGLIGIGPVLRTRYSHSTIRNFNLAVFLAQFSTTKSFFLSDRRWQDILLRTSVSSTENIYTRIFYRFSGYNPKIKNETRVPIYLNHCTCGNSIFLIYHMRQLIFTNKIKGFDYGRKKNMLEYSQPNPLEYNVSKIQVPVALMNAVNDGCSSLIDRSLMLKEIPNIIGTKLLPGTFSNHFDYFISQKIEATETILQWLQKMLLL